MNNAASLSKSVLTLVGIFSCAVIIFLSISNLVNPLEFDTVVFINLVIFFHHGKPWSPVFLNDTGIVCELDRCSQFDGGVHQTNFLPVDYTSGFFFCLALA